jgi:hypothetical protein
LRGRKLQHGAREGAFEEGPVRCAARPWCCSSSSVSVTVISDNDCTTTSVGFSVWLRNSCRYTYVQGNFSMTMGDYFGKGGPRFIIQIEGSSKPLRLLA